MKAFIVHVSDPTGVDDRAVVVAENDTNLGDAIKVAIDDLTARHGGKLAFPLFIDVHPSPAYSHKEWIYGLPKAASGAAANASPVR